jgi:hypothetical protein
MEHLAQSLGTALVEGGVDPLGSGRVLAQRLFDAPSLKRFMAVRAVWGSQPTSGLWHRRSSPLDLATTEDEGVGRAQAVLQDLALRVQKRTHEDRSSHGDQRSTLQTTCSENALEGKFSEVGMQHPA